MIDPVAPITETRTIAMQGDITFQYAECIREVRNFGETQVINMCKGTVHTIPWGTMDWAGVGIFGAVMFLVFLGFLLHWLVYPRRRR